jgi:autotransporter-associated beta strand protein
MPVRSRSARRHWKITFAVAGTSAGLLHRAAIGALTWNFYYTATDGSTDNAAGQLVTTDYQSNLNGYRAIGATGFYNSEEISGVVPAVYLDGNDNILFPSSPYLDGSGIYFWIAGTDQYFGLFNYFGTVYDEGRSSGALTVDAVPQTAVTWSNGAASNTWDASSLNWSVDGFAAPYTDGNNVVFNDDNGGAANYAVNVIETVSPGSISVNNSAGNYTLGYAAGVIAGTGSLSKTGTGTLVIAAPDTSTGTFTVNGGTVQVAGNGLDSALIALYPNSVLEYTTSSNTFEGASVYQGTGTLLINGTGKFIFGANGNDVVNLAVGALVDVEGGAFTGSSSHGGIWTNNDASLNIAKNAAFDIVEGGTSDSMQIDALTGAGDFSGGYSANPGGLTTATIGVAGGSGTFSGSIFDDIQAHFAIVKTGSGTETFSGANSYTGGTTVNAGALVIAANGALPDGAVSVTGGVLQLAGNTGAAPLTSLSVTGSGVLDLTNNHLIINFGNNSDPISSIYAWLKSGFNNGGWNGPGIISSTAQALTNGLRYGVGWADGKDGVVHGLSSGQIEIKYTLLGDANLDGTVNGSDFSILAANFGLGVTNWDQGNFLFSSSVNGSDFSALAVNFGQGDNGADAGVSQSDVAALDAFAVANNLPVPTIAAVPEPAAGAIALLTAIGGLLPRLRRKAPGLSPGN